MTFVLAVCWKSQEARMSAVPLFCPTSQGLFGLCVCILATGVPYTLGMEVCSLIQNTGKMGFCIWEVEDKTKKI